MNILQKTEFFNFSFQPKGNFTYLKGLFRGKQISRFAITELKDKEANCEFAEFDSYVKEYKNIFDFVPRTSENQTKFTAAMIIPTGIGAETGGDSGDGNAAARLIGNSVDVLITHPNVVNAADINEMTPNTVYVEGSVLNRLIMGTVGVSPVRGNRILVLVDTPEKEYIKNHTINCAGAARVTLGCDVDVLEITDPPHYKFYYNEKGMAIGQIHDLEKLVDIIQKYKGEYDSFALHTMMEGDSEELFAEYFGDKLLVNPWGGIESIITHTISNLLDVPCAHAPLFSDGLISYEYDVVSPKKAPETLSKTELFCVIKGMYKAPKIVEPQIAEGVITSRDINVLITPDRCISLPLIAALEQGITVIAVDDNTNLMKNDLSKLPWKHNQFFRAANYFEASGILTALKNGLSPNSIIRPIQPTKIL